MPKKPKWNEQPCPECKEPVAHDATRCPHCQAVYTREQMDARAKTHSTTLKMGFGCLGVVALILLASMCSVTPEEQSKTAGGSAPDAAASVVSADDTDHWPKAGTASPQVAAAVKRFNDDIMSAAADCDAAAKRVSDVAQGLGESTSVYDGYSAASRAKDACEASWQQAEKIDVPDALKGTVADEADKVRSTCGDAFFAKREAAAAMASVFDGDMKPSSIDSAKGKATTAQAGTIACVAGLYTVAGMAGVDPKVLGGDAS